VEGYKIHLSLFRRIPVYLMLAGLVFFSLRWFQFPHHGLKDMWVPAVLVYMIVVLISAHKKVKIQLTGDVAHRITPQGFRNEERGESVPWDQVKSVVHYADRNALLLHYPFAPRTFLEKNPLMKWNYPPVLYVGFTPKSIQEPIEQVMAELSRYKEIKKEAHVPLHLRRFVGRS